MRVLHIAQGASPNGGAERAIREIIRACNIHDIAATVASVPGEFDFGVPRYDLARLHRSITKLPQAVNSVWKAIRLAQPHIVHFHSIGYFLAFKLAMRYRRLPCVLGMHGLPEQDYRRIGWLLRKLAHPAIAYGPGTARILAEYGVDHRLIPLSVSPPPPPARRDELDRLLGIAPGTWVAFAIGRLVDQKNHLVLIRMLPHLHGLHLAIAGEGVLRESLLAEAKRLGVADRLTLLGFREDARALLAAADVAVMPSTWEGFGMAAAEAMLAGVPLIVADSPGLKEWVADGETGLVAPPHNPQAWAAALRRVLDDADLRQRLTAHAATCARQFTPQNLADAHRDVYLSLLNDKQL